MWARTRWKLKRGGKKVWIDTSQWVHRESKTKYCGLQDDGHGTGWKLGRTKGQCVVRESGGRVLLIFTRARGCPTRQRMDRLPRAVVEVRVPRRPGAVEDQGQLLVVLVVLTPHPKGLEYFLHGAHRQGPSASASLRGPANAPCLCACAATSQRLELRVLPQLWACWGLSSPVLLADPRPPRMQLPSMAQLSSPLRRGDGR